MQQSFVRSGSSCRVQGQQSIHQVQGGLWNLAGEVFLYSATIGPFEFEGLKIW